MSQGLTSTGVGAAARAPATDSVDRLLTVLLLVKDRAPYTLRWMSYASQTRFPFKVLIADGSADDRAAAVLADPTRFPGVNFEYVRYPRDRTLADFYKKKVAALERVTTPYVVKACNDDFYVVDGLRRSIHFLEKNADFCSARGQIFNFLVHGAESADDTRNTYGQIDDFDEYKPSESNANSAAAPRLEAHCAHYVTTWHDIGRTELVTSVHRQLLEMSPTDLRVCDHIIDCLTIAAGKIHRAGLPYMLHQSNPADGSGRDLSLQFPTYRDWTAAPWWGKDTDALFDAVASQMSKSDGTSVPDARKQFRAAYVDIYLRDRFAEDSRLASATEPTRLGVGQRVRQMMARGALRKAYRVAVRRFRNWRTRRAIEAAGWSEAMKPVAEFLRMPPSRNVTEATDRSRLESARA